MSGIGYVWPDVDLAPDERLGTMVRKVVSEIRREIEAHLLRLQPGQRLAVSSPVLEGDGFNVTFTVLEPWDCDPALSTIYAREEDLLVNHADAIVKEVATTWPAPVRDRLIDHLSQDLGDTYDCTRAWSAWEVGTMTADDFEPAAERAVEIADALLALIPPGDPMGQFGALNAAGAALMECVTTFSRYTRGHLDKRPPDVDKARRNSEMATVCIHALEDVQRAISGSPVVRNPAIAMLREDTSQTLGEQLDAWVKEWSDAADPNRTNGNLAYFLGRKLWTLANPQGANAG